MSKNSPKTFADVRTAFEDRSVLDASRRKLEELLAATVCERSDDAVVRAQVHEMSLALRQFIADRRGAKLRRPSHFAVCALLLLGASLLWCGAQVYSARHASGFASSEMPDAAALAAQALQNDHRATLTIDELANNAPTLRNGTAQAWWAGEQAREVQRLEALAKKQALAGDYDGASRTVTRADEIRSAIPALSEVERTAVR